MNPGDPSANARDPAALQELLDREIDAASSLAAVLAGEREALTGESTAAVTAAAARKIELFAVIEALEAQRRKLCDASGVLLERLPHGTPPRNVTPPATAGSAPAMSGASPAIAQRWAQLLAVIAGCRVANEVNGYIINARRGQIGQLLQIIRGGAPVTYGPQGRQQGASLRALARA
jgi:flagellar biosynthesis/type III secretory pathway chaperone